MCVGLSVCPRGYLRNDTHDLYQFFVHDDDAWAVLGVFFPIDNALHSIDCKVWVGLHTAGEV